VARRWLAIARAPLAVAASTIAVLVYDPFVDHGRLGCPFHEMTGLLCPGCGSTRAWWLLAHGDVLGGMRHNLLFLPAVVWLVVDWVATTWPARTTSLPAWLRSPTAIPPGALRALAVLVVAFTVLRNVPAFAWMAPPEPT
jgi:hypothetical protein